MDLGEVEAALLNFEAALMHRPGDVRLIANLAAALISLDRLDRAYAVTSRDAALADPTFQLARIRGFLASQLEDFPAAVEALEHVVAHVPDDWESWNNLGNAHRAIGDLEGGLEAHRRSVEFNDQAAPSRLNYGSALFEAQRLDEAEAVFRKMAQDFPQDAKPLRELHLLLKDQLRDQEAVDALTAAIEREPNNVELLLGRASHLSLLLKMEEAEAGYRHVLEIDPDNADAYLGLGIVFELTNSTERLADLIKEAEQRGIGRDPVNFMKAFHHRRTKEFAKGLAALELVDPELETARRFGLLGQLLEGVGRYDEAFDAYSRMNEIFLEDRTFPELRAANYRQFITDCPKIVTTDWVTSWRAEAVADLRPAPVFLVGFPRSGTTLLDTMLMSHPDVEVLEEEPTLRDALEHMPPMAEWPSASDEQIGAARDAYFKRAASLASMAPGKLLVDKNPLTMTLLPLVRRLFPDAKIILALRHPCDVALSCYVANFRLNDAMSNFLRLDTTAELYDACFTYYEHAQRLMPMRTHTVVYEKVVADRESELRQLFEFLDLDWHDAVLEHEKTAQKRGRIKTASYAQVVEPIYTRSAGRWVHYRKHLEPIIPTLEPWIRKFGYSTDD
jgi:tetratricopeptide (TPR) repeat protein